MTDVNDIVKRLRTTTAVRYPGFANLYTEAADVIEMLRDEVRAARAWQDCGEGGTERSVGLNIKWKNVRALNDLKLEGLA